METEELDLTGLLLIKPKIFRDHRGFFLERYQKQHYWDKGIEIDFVQDNHSFSCYKTIRGMHFQDEPGQDKLVSVISGQIFDVAVDIRPNSKTFGQWEAVLLDDTHYHQLLIPAGFAHGFCVLSKQAHVLYKISQPFQSEKEKGFYWKDPSIGISWPFHDPILSERDAAAPMLQDVFRQYEEVRI